MTDMRNEAEALMRKCKRELEAKRTAELVSQEFYKPPQTWTPINADDKETK